MTKRWAAKAFESVKEGSLKRLGWPDVGKVVAATSAENRGSVVRKLLLLANASSDPATKAKARSAIRRIKSKLGD